MRTYTIQFSDEPTEVEIATFLDALSAGLVGEGWNRVHGGNTQRGTLFADDDSIEWLEEQLEGAEWVVSYRCEES